MAYKKFIKKDGKLYGPYIYHSRRVNGKVISEYQGTARESSRKHILLMIGLIMFAVFVCSILYFNRGITGKAVSDLSAVKDEAKNLEAKTKIIYPAVYFTLISRQTIKTADEPIQEIPIEQPEIIETPTEQPNETQITGEVMENSTEEMPAELEINKEIQPEETITEPQAEETTADEPATESSETAPITGGIISGFFKNVANFFLSLTPTGNAISENVIEKQISGQVNANEQFVYELKEGESAEILSGSVKTDSKSLPDDFLKLIIEGNKAIITTEYFEEEIFKETGKSEEIIQEKNVTIKEENIIETNPSKKVLEDSEKDLILGEFGNATIETFKSELFKGKYIIGYRLGNYEIEYSYDASLDNETLNLQMENDRVKWLKDIAKKISSTETEREEVEKFIENHPIEETE